MIYIGNYKNIGKYVHNKYIPVSYSNVRPIWYVEGSNEPAFAPDPIWLDDMKYHGATEEDFAKVYKNYLDTVPYNKFTYYMYSERVYVFICRYDKEDSLQEKVFVDYITKRFSKEIIRLD